MAVLNGKIYVAGGYHEQRNLDAVEVQPPAQSRRRCGLGSRRSRRRSAAQSWRRCGRTLAGCQVYDPRAGAWEIAKSLTMPRRGFGLAALDG